MNARRRNKERNITWRNSRGQQLLDTFRALSRVHFMHTICRFEFWEVRIPTLQTVHKSELKWRSYGHWKQVTPSWKAISQAVKSQSVGCEISLFMPNGDFQLANFCSPCCMLWNPPKCFQLFATNSFRFFFFRYFLFKSPFSPCNPPIIGFLS